MKKSLLFVAAITSLLMSCETLQIEGDFNYDYTTTKDLAGVPGNPDTVLPGGITAYLPSITEATGSKEKLAEKKVDAANVQTINLTSFELDIVTDSAADFMDTMNIYASVPGKTEILMAHRYGTSAATGNKFECIADNIKDYVMADSLTVRFGGHFTKKFSKNTKVKWKSNYQVKYLDKGTSN